MNQYSLQAHWSSAVECMDWTIDNFLCSQIKPCPHVFVSYVNYEVCCNVTHIYCHQQPILIFLIKLQSDCSHPLSLCAVLGYRKANSPREPTQHPPIYPKYNGKNTFVLISDHTKSSIAHKLHFFIWHFLAICGSQIVHKVWCCRNLLDSVWGFKRMSEQRNVIK